MPKKAAPAPASGDNLPADAYGPPPGEKTYSCKVCGRKFVQDTLKKHEQICKKVTTKKRKVFDSGKQRAGDGSDVTYANVKAVEKEKKAGAFKPPKTHWKERHEQFVSAVRAAKHVDYALKTGTPLPPPPKSNVPSDYVKCDYCGRNFSASAAERHIPFCKEQHSRKNVSGPNEKQKAAMNARKNQNLAPGSKPAGGKSGSRTPVGSAGPRGGNAPKNSSIPQPKRSNSAPRSTGRNQNLSSNPKPSKAPAQPRGKSPARGVTNDMKKLNVRK